MVVTGGGWCWKVLRMKKQISRAEVLRILMECWEKDFVGTWRLILYFLHVIEMIVDDVL